jgi:hypothetical protein
MEVKVLNIFNCNNAYIDVLDTMMHKIRNTYNSILVITQNKLSIVNFSDIGVTIKSVSYLFKLLMNINNNKNLYDCILIDTNGQISLQLYTCIFLWDYISRSKDVDIIPQMCVTMSCNEDINLDNVANNIFKVSNKVINTISYRQFFVKTQFMDKLMNVKETVKIIIERTLTVDLSEKNIWVVFATSSTIDKITNLISNGVDNSNIKIFALNTSSSPNFNLITRSINKHNFTIIVCDSIGIFEVSMIENITGIFDMMMEECTVVTGSSNMLVEEVQATKKTIIQRSSLLGKTRRGFHYKMCDLNYFKNLKSDYIPIIDVVSFYRPIKSLLKINIKNVYNNMYDNKISQSVLHLQSLNSYSEDIKLPISYLSSIILNRIIREKDIPIFPVICYVSLIESYILPYFNYSNVDNVELHYKKYFFKYNKSSEIGTLLEMLIQYIECNGGSLDIDKNFYTYCKLNSLNISTLKRCLTTISDLNDIILQYVNFEIASFTSDGIMKKINPILFDVYGNNIAMYSNKNKSYIINDKKVSVNTIYKICNSLGPKLYGIIMNNNHLCITTSICK